MQNVSLLVYHTSAEGSNMQQESEPVIERRSLAEQVYAYLCNSIRSGKLKYGQTIPTKSLAQELQISMMPVREAIKRLEVDGLVEIKPRSMCVLRTPTKETILSAISAREMLEVFSVQSIYQTVEAEDLAGLRGIIEHMRAAISGEKIDLKTYIAYDWQFHAALCDLARNEFIGRFYRELNIHLNMNYMYDIGIKPNISQTFRDHIDLVDALAEHAPSAVDIIRKHLDISRRNILSGRFFSESTNPEAADGAK